MKNDKIALITGATAGIGRATAKQLAHQGFRIIACGRRTERLDSLKEELKGTTSVYALTFDVRDRHAVAAQIGSLPSDWQAIDVLVNNAGNAHGMDLLHEGNPDDWEAMLDINVKGFLYVYKAVIDGMIARNSGHIVNLGSIAGKEVYPKGNVYCATKHAVDALNTAMRLELNPYNIRVTTINPGLVNTEFSNVRFKGDQAKANSVYQGMTPLYAEDIAEIIAFAVSRPPHVNLGEILVLPTDQASSTVVRREV